MVQPRPNINIQPLANFEQIAEVVDVETGRLSIVRRPKRRWIPNWLREIPSCAPIFPFLVIATMVLVSHAVESKVLSIVFASLLGVASLVIGVRWTIQLVVNRRAWARHHHMMMQHMQQMRQNGAVPNGAPMPMMPPPMFDPRFAPPPPGMMMMPFPQSGMAPPPGTQTLLAQTGNPLLQLSLLNRDFTPNDYEMLSRLDQGLPPQGLSERDISRLPAFTLPGDANAAASAGSNENASSGAATITVSASAPVSRSTSSTEVSIEAAGSASSSSSSGITSSASTSSLPVSRPANIITAILQGSPLPTANGEKSDGKDLVTIHVEKEQPKRRGSDDHIPDLSAVESENEHAEAPLLRPVDLASSSAPNTPMMTPLLSGSPTDRLDTLSLGTDHDEKSELNLADLRKKHHPSSRSSSSSSSSSVLSTYQTRTSFEDPSPPASPCGSPSSSSCGYAPMFNPPPIFIGAVLTQSGPLQTAPTGATAKSLCSQPQAGDKSKPSILISSAPARDSCCICLEDKRPGDVCRTLPCLHAYHAPCIDPWLRVKAACPVCKSKVSFDDAFASP